MHHGAETYCYRTVAHYPCLYFHYTELIVSSFKLLETKHFLFFFFLFPVCGFACVGLQWHTNTATNLQNCEEILEFKHIQWISGNRLELCISQQGRKTQQILNTQQTYQLRTAECGLGHLPETERIFTDTNKLGRILLRYALPSGSIGMWIESIWMCRMLVNNINNAVTCSADLFRPSM